MAPLRREAQVFKESLLHAGAPVPERCCAQGQQRNGATHGAAGRLKTVWRPRLMARCGHCSWCGQMLCWDLGGGVCVRPAAATLQQVASQHAVACLWYFLCSDLCCPSFERQAPSTGDLSASDDISMRQHEEVGLRKLQLKATTVLDAVRRRSADLRCSYSCYCARQSRAQTRKRGHLGQVRQRTADH